MSGDEACRGVAVCYHYNNFPYMGKGAMLICSIMRAFVEERDFQKEAQDSNSYSNALAVDCECKDSSDVQSLKHRKVASVPELFPLKLCH